MCGNFYILQHYEMMVRHEMKEVHINKIFNIVIEQRILILKKPPLQPFYMRYNFIWKSC